MSLERLGCHLESMLEQWRQGGSVVPVACTNHVSASNLISHASSLSMVFTVCGT